MPDVDVSSFPPDDLDFERRARDLARLRQDDTIEQVEAALRAEYPQARIVLRDPRPGNMPREDCRRGLALTVISGMLLLLMAGVALAGGKSVVVKESNNRYHFTPNDITVGVGQSVTWSDGSDAPHTVSSDNAGGPLDGHLSPGGADYSATFSKVGDYAYHCNVHPYIHGVVHAAALPTTDVLASVSGSGAETGGLPFATIAVIAGMALGAAGLLTFVLLRRRAVQA